MKSCSYRRDRFAKLAQAQRPENICLDAFTRQYLITFSYKLIQALPNYILFFLQFIAHRHVQLLLADIVYKGCPLAQYFVQGLFLYAVYTLTFPIWALVFLFHQECKISKYMVTPFGKFVSHTSQFCVFMTLLIISSFRDSHEPSIIGQY